MRGKHFSPRAFSPIPRTIPARTGYAARKLLRKSCIWTYPLTCGANEGFWEQARLGADISPLMRGKPPIAVVIQPDLGLIPARAGQTSTRCRHTTGPWTYPRVRGVHFMVMLNKGLAADLSPRTRVTPLSLAPSGGRIGLIPAYAGYTSDLYGKSSNPSNNPRARGVHTKN